MALKMEKDAKQLNKMTMKDVWKYYNKSFKKKTQLNNNRKWGSETRFYELLKGTILR